MYTSANSSESLGGGMRSIIAMIYKAGTNISFIGSKIMGVRRKREKLVLHNEIA